MKYLLLVLSVILAGEISAQTLLPIDTNIPLQMNAATMNGANSLAKIAACGPDTNGYALAKATGLEALNINNSTSAGAAGQYFDAPQAISISGVSFYAWKADVTGGTTMNVTAQIFAAGADSMPTGIALATTTTIVDTTFSPGTLNVLRKNATFTNPVTVTGAYVVVISNPSATPMSMVFNSWAAADGGQEWLSSVDLFGTWTRSYNVNVGGTTFDADCLFEPHTSYVLTSSFIVDDPCFANGLALNFTNASSPIVNNRMYNVAAFQNLTDLSYTWNYGDASPTENLIDASHTYASASSYTVTLTDTIFGWTSNCSTDTMVLLGTLPIADFSSVETGLTSTFTNSSIAGVTYLWDFGDGNTSSATNPVHTYTAAGAYTVCLTTTNPCGSSVSCMPITVTCPVPSPAFTSSTTGLAVNFTNSSTAGAGAAYFWDFGDGNTSTMMNAMHTYGVDGNYVVCLVVSDACGADSTCQTISVTSCVNPTAGYTIAGTSPAYSFTNTSTTTGTTTYSWDFGDGNTASTMDASNTYATNGTFTVTLVVIDSCGTNTFTSTVDVSGIGLDELSLVDVAVYPNPSNGVFTIETSASMEKAYVTDLSGKVIYTVGLSGYDATINASQFANGTYFLSIRFGNDLIQTVRLEVVN